MLTQLVTNSKAANLSLFCETISELFAFKRKYSLIVFNFI